jgi:UDP-GlcNAc:undecaprenyl-phosphate/decaprenyl-phosphate GlcNAc-1-phosphate transferase
LIEPFLAFLLAAIGTWVLTPVVIRVAERYGAMDQPGERKVHDHPVPRLGGVAVYGAFTMVGLLALVAIPRIRGSFEQGQNFWLSLAVGSTVIFLLGLYDDVYHASVLAKFSIQFAAAACVMFFGNVRIEHLGIPFDGTLELGWLWIPLTALWIVGVTNAFNLIDGLDGLAGGVAFIATVTLFGISLLQTGSGKFVLTTAALSGALLGFLRYNRNPARIFLGDCGSMFLGFLLAVLSVVGAAKRTTTLALLIPILIVGVPVFDTLFAMARRLLKKLFVEKDVSPGAFSAMFRADRQHIHHVLMEMGYTHRRTVVILYGLAAVFGLLALAAVVAQDDRVSFGLMLAGAAAFIMVRQFGKARFFGGGQNSGDNAGK